MDERNLRKMKKLKINFVGSFTQGYVGEVADEVQLAREFERLGHKVIRVPRDIWKGYCDGTKPNKDWVLPENADINIICKWHHFNHGGYIRKLKELSGGPVFYWTWDYMKWPQTHEWHRRMAESSDLHLTNENGLEEIMYMAQWNINHYYFPFDVADDDLAIYKSKKKYDVIFTGSCIGEGVRKEYIEKLNKHFKIKVFAWNPDEWKKMGIDADPAVYGEEFNKVVSEAKICLHFSVHDDCNGYWSNRVGKTLMAGGFLLARYTPGMELALRDGAEYFRTCKEASEKIDFYLKNEYERETIAKRGLQIGRDNYSSKARIKQLEILIYRYLQGE